MHTSTTTIRVKIAETLASSRSGGFNTCSIQLGLHPRTRGGFVVIIVPLGILARSIVTSDGVSQDSNTRVPEWFRGASTISNARRYPSKLLAPCNDPIDIALPFERFFQTGGKLSGKPAMSRSMFRLVFSST